MADMYFENLPSTNTPLNKINLDKLNDIKVSPTEPTTGEKVWIQHTGNLFNKNNYVIRERYIGFVLNLEKGKTYTISSNLPLSCAKFAELATQDDDTVGPQTWQEFTSWTFVAGDNTDQHLNNILYLGTQNNSLSTNLSDFDNYNIQIEEGSVATTYKPYVDEKILIKKENGAYEKFYDEKLLTKDLLYRGSVTANISKVAGSQSSITAIIPTGYTFFCWLQPATYGWVSNIYTENPFNATTNIWNTTQQGNDQGGVICDYICVKAGMSSN